MYNICVCYDNNIDDIIDIVIAKAENSIREREASTQHAAHILDLERNLSEAGRDREEARVALREISSKMDRLLLFNL